MSVYEARTQVISLIVSVYPTQVGHSRILDTSRQVFDMRSYVSHLKNIIF